jgi:hypothetical protein
MDQSILTNIWVILAMALWTIPWKGVALWKSACQNEKWWFIALLLINTIGLLEILYIFVFSKKKGIEIQK